MITSVLNAAYKQGYVTMLAIASDWSTGGIQAQLRGWLQHTIHNRCQNELDLEYCYGRADCLADLLQQRGAGYHG